MNEIVTIDGGSFTRPARLRVIQLSGSGVATFAVEDTGAYGVLPVASGGAYATTSVTGSGTGATIAGPVFVQSQAVRRMRRIELILDAGVRFRGLTLRPQDKLLAWPRNRRAPKVMIVGDSQNAGTYLPYPGGNMSYGWLQRLGLWEHHVLSANGGTGWVTANGQAPAWSHASRVADVIAQAPDLLVYDGGQNDASDVPAITAAVAATLGVVLAALPRLRIVVLGPVANGSTAVVSAFAAAIAQQRYRSRVRLVDNVGEGWVTGTGRAGSPSGFGNGDFYMASDGAHLSQAGVDFRAAILAPRIAEAVLDMIGG
jgi:lysophospholipase L1-like esterase